MNNDNNNDYVYYQQCLKESMETSPMSSETYMEQHDIFSDQTLIKDRFVAREKDSDMPFLREFENGDVMEYDIVRDMPERGEDDAEFARFIVSLTPNGEPQSARPEIVETDIYSLTNKDIAEELQKLITDNREQTREQFANLSMTELGERYQQLSVQVKQMDTANMTGQDRQVMAEYQEIQQFYTDIEQSLAFVSQSAEMTFMEDGTEISSMLQPEEYGELLNTLSDNRNPEFERFLLAETLSEEQQYELQLIQKMPENVMKNPVMQETVKSAEKPEYSVAEVREAVEKAQQLMQMYEIDKADSLEQTGIVFQEMKEENKLIVLSRDSREQERQAEQREAEEPVVVVESSDGYIQNTSKTLTEENVGHAITENGRNALVQNGNEIHQEVAKETTNVPSEQTPNIHLEQGKPTSTLEDEKGITAEDKTKYGIEL